MKNKEIEELLNELKDKYSYEPSCNMEVETYISPKKILRMLGEIDVED